MADSGLPNRYANNLVIRVLGEGAGIFRQSALNLCVHLVDVVGGAHDLIGAAEDHGEHVDEGAAPASHRVVAGFGMLVNRVGHPGVRQLQQDRAAGPEEADEFPANLPHHRAGAVDPGQRINRALQGLACPVPEFFLVDKALFGHGILPR
jgi:hypothetical protein